MSQDARARSIALKLELVSNGSTQSFNGNGGHAAPGHRVLAGQFGRDLPPHLRFLDAWRRAHTESGRERLLEQAESEWQRLTGRDGVEPPRADERPSESRSDLDKRIVAEGAGWSVKDCELHFSCPGSWIRQARRMRACDGEFGLPMERPQSLKERQRLVGELVAQGKTLREIGDLLGVHHFTVSRDLRRGKMAA